MTLYLAGKSNDNTLVLASDGRAFSGDKKQILEDSLSKINVVAPGMVSCSFGTHQLTESIEGIISGVYKLIDDETPSKFQLRNRVEDVIKSATPVVLYHLMEYTHRNPKFSESLTEGICDIFGKYDGEIRTGRITASSQRPYVETRFEDSTMEFPIRSGGLWEMANTEVVPALIKYGTSLEPIFLKGLFLYVIEKIGRFTKSVGGEKFIGELSDEGYVTISPQERLEVDMLAEEIREELKSEYPLLDVGRLKSSKDMLINATEALHDFALTGRLAFDSLATGYLKGANSESLESAFFLYEIFQQFKDNPIFTLDDEISKVHIIFGDAYLKVGEEGKAKGAYQSVITLGQSYWTKDRGHMTRNAVIHYALALKKLCEIVKSDNWEDLKTSFIDMAVYFKVLTREEIDNLSLDIKRVDRETYEAHLLKLENEPKKQ